MKSQNLAALALLLQLSSTALGQVAGPDITSVVTRTARGDTTQGACAPLNGTFDCSYTIERRDEFKNTSSDFRVTLNSVELLPLDPEDVGFSDMEVPTVLRAVTAATMLHPDVDFWGAYWINTRDPARVQWSSLPVSLSGANGESDFPVTLAPGESLLLTSTVSTSAVLNADPGTYEGELVIGWTFEASVAPTQPPVALQAGDADQDLDFDQLDLVKVQQAGKYLTGQPATWGDGDWNGAPGGSPGSPPAGDGLFSQFDIVAALTASLYLTGPYGALGAAGQPGDSQTSIRYDARSGELSVDAPAGIQLTSINIDSAAGIFTGNAATNLGGSFDNDSDQNIFKATFGSSFGSLSFGNVAQPGLAEAFVLGDLTVVGSLAGGGGLGAVDLIYVPEPAMLTLAWLGLLAFFAYQVRKCDAWGFFLQ